jgi:hypothetical protein
MLMNDQRIPNIFEMKSLGEPTNRSKLKSLHAPSSRAPYLRESDCEIHVRRHRCRRLDTRDWRR